MQSLHFGFVPSQRLLRDLQTSHYFAIVSGKDAEDRYCSVSSASTYCDGSAPPWVVDTSICIPSLQGVDAILAAFFLHGDRVVTTL